MSLYKKTHLRLLPPPEPRAPLPVEVHPVTYQIRIFPFSAHAVVVFFRFVRPVTGRAPEPWEIVIESMNGPQVLGIDLDHTLTRQKGIMLTYRQHIQNCTDDIINNSYGGVWHVLRNYPAKSGIVVL